MKHKILTFITLLIITSNSLFANLYKAEITATGLTCSMCSNAILKQLESIKDVDKVDVDLNQNLFVVYFKLNNTHNPNDLKTAVEKAGFYVGSMVIYFENNEFKHDYILLDSDSSPINKDKKYRVLDKGYVTNKEFKKLSKIYSKIESYKTLNEMNFHLKLIQ